MKAALAALALCLSLLCPPSLRAQDYISLGVSYGDEKQEIRGRLPAARPGDVHFSLKGRHPGVTLSFGQTDALRLGSALFDVEWFADIAPRSHRGPADTPQFLRAANIDTRADTARLGLALRHTLRRWGHTRLSGAIAFGLSHTNLTVTDRLATSSGRDTTGFAAVSLRAQRPWDKDHTIWLDLRYVASPAISIRSGTGHLRHETSVAQLRFGFTYSLH